MEALFVVIVLGILLGAPLALGLAIGFAWGRRSARRRDDYDGGTRAPAQHPRPAPHDGPRPSVPPSSPYPAPGPGAGAPPEGGGVRPVPGSGQGSGARPAGASSGVGQGAGSGAHHQGTGRGAGTGTDLGARHQGIGPYAPRYSRPGAEAAQPGERPGPSGSGVLINLGLYVASLLLITGSALLVTFTAPAAIKVAGLWLLSLLYYGVGLVLFLSVRRLRAAGISMTGTGLAVLPFAGLATWTLLLPDAGSLIWLLTSLVGTAALFAACALMNSRVLGWLMVAFLVSVSLSMVSTVGLGLVWYFVATTALATVLTLLVRLLPERLPRSVLASVVQTHRLIVPGSAAATVFTAPWAEARQICIAFAVFTAYATLFHVLHRTRIELLQLRAFPAVVLSSGVLWLAGSWYWAGWGAWAGLLAATASCGFTRGLPGGGPAAPPGDGDAAARGHDRTVTPGDGRAAGQRSGASASGGTSGLAGLRHSLGARSELVQAWLFAALTLLALWYMAVGERVRETPGGPDVAGWSAERLLAEPAWAPPVWLAAVLTLAAAAFWGRRFRVPALAQTVVLAVSAASLLSLHGLGPVWIAAALVLVVLLAPTPAPAPGGAAARTGGAADAEAAGSGTAGSGTARRSRGLPPLLWLPSALALGLGALTADVAPSPAARHGLLVAVAALACVALAQALMPRERDRPVARIAVPVAASAVLWPAGATALGLPSGAEGPAVLDVVLLWVLLAAPVLVGAAIVLDLARSGRGRALLDGLAAAYLLSPLVTGLLLSIPAGSRIPGGAVPGWAPAAVYAVLLLTALGALAARRGQAAPFWILITRIAVLPLTAELAVRLLDSWIGIAWAIAVVVLAQHLVSWVTLRGPAPARPDAVLGWVLLAAQTLTALLLWLTVPGAAAAFSAGAMLLLAAAAAGVYELRRTLPGYAALPHLLALAGLAAADGAGQSLAPRAEATPVLAGLGILLAALISLGARILREAAGRGEGRAGAAGELVWLGLLVLGGLVPDRTGWVACAGVVVAAGTVLLLLRETAGRAGGEGTTPVGALPRAELRRHVVVWTGLIVLLRLLGYFFDGPQPVLWPLLVGVALAGLALAGRDDAPDRARAYLWFAFAAEVLAWLVSMAYPGTAGPAGALWGLAVPALLVAALALGMVAAVLTRSTAPGWAWATLITAVLLWYARNLGPLLLIILALAITGVVIWFLLRTGRRD
ncbi:hypothetical protein [Rothia halotolerans]|uniref:hypothetical protein n=1 Tax=Rothia halotolerans TaxID=405770 RepID=UPI00101B9F28|nr:hypothetical protein [Rothia halotolerans]